MQLQMSVRSVKSATSFLVRIPLDYSFEMQIVNLSHLSFKIVLIKYK